MNYVYWTEGLSCPRGRIHPTGFGKFAAFTQRKDAYLGESLLFIAYIGRQSMVTSYLSDDGSLSLVRNALQRNHAPGPARQIDGVKRVSRLGKSLWCRVYRR